MKLWHKIALLWVILASLVYPATRIVAKAVHSTQQPWGIKEVAAPCTVVLAVIGISTSLILFWLKQQDEVRQREAAGKQRLDDREAAAKQRLDDREAAHREKCIRLIGILERIPYMRYHFEVFGSPIHYDREIVHEVAEGHRKAKGEMYDLGDMPEAEKAIHLYEIGNYYTFLPDDPDGSEARRRSYRVGFFRLQAIYWSLRVRVYGDRYGDTAMWKRHKQVAEFLGSSAEWIEQDVAVNDEVE